VPACRQVGQGQTSDTLGEPGLKTGIDPDGEARKKLFWYWIELQIPEQIKRWGKERVI